MMRNRFLAAALAIIGLGICADSVQADESRTLTLSQSLAEALNRNHVLLAAAQDSAMDKFLVRESRADLFPDLKAIGSYSRYEETNIILPIHKVGVFPPLDDDIFEGRLELQIPLFDGGRRRAMVHVKEAGATSSSARLDETRMQTIAGVSRLFVESRRIDDGLTLMSRRLAVLRQRRREMNPLMAEGRVSKSDLSLVEASLAEAWADSLGLALGLRETSFRLAFWLGSETPVYPVLTSDSAVVKPIVFLEAESGEFSPGVREAAGRLEQASARYSVAAKAYWPELTGFAALLSRSGDDLDFTGEWSAGVAVKMPLFTGGRRHAGRQAAAAARLAAERRYTAVRMETQANENLAIERWRSANARLESLAEAAEAKRLAVSAQRELYESGRLTLAELLNQESELLSLEFKAADMAYAARYALLDLHVTAGTLTPVRAQIIVEGNS